MAGDVVRRALEIDTTELMIRQLEREFPDGPSWWPEYLALVEAPMCIVVVEAVDRTRADQFTVMVGAEQCALRLDLPDNVSRISLQPTTRLLDIVLSPFDGVHRPPVGDRRPVVESIERLAAGAAPDGWDRTVRISSATGRGASTLERREVAMVHGSDGWWHWTVAGSDASGDVESARLEPSGPHEIVALVRPLLPPAHDAVDMVPS